MTALQMFPLTHLDAMTQQTSTLCVSARKNASCQIRANIAASSLAHTCGNIRLTRKVRISSITRSHSLILCSRKYTYRICGPARRSTARSVRTCIRACPRSSDRRLKINFAISFEIIFSVPRAYHHSLQYLKSGRGNDLVDSSFIFFTPSSVSPIPRRLFIRPIRYDSLHRLTASLAIKSEK